MKRKLSYALIVIALAACGGDGKRADQSDYQTVQEGSAAGVTATIHGPGETLPPPTSTNMDTTTAFTLDTNAAPQTPPGTIAGTLPPPSQPPTGTYMPSPAPITRPVPQRPVEPAPPPPPPPTDTTVTEPEPIPPPTETAPPPPEEEEEEETPPETTTAPPPPPPPHGRR